MKLFDLTGEVAVVIGATGVLGGALAEGLAEAGAKIAVLGRNAERGAARVQAIQARGGQAAFLSPTPSRGAASARRMSDWRHRWALRRFSSMPPAATIRK